MRLLIVDGYVDEPGCLGVPPYISPYIRYLFGAAYLSGIVDDITYCTIDQVRRVRHEDRQRWAAGFDFLVFLTGVSVPGSYIGGTPAKYSEIRAIAPLFGDDTFKVLCGPATRFGIGEEGGKPSIPVDGLRPLFDLVITGDAEIVLAALLSSWGSGTRPPAGELRPDMAAIEPFAVAGAAVITQHPNFRGEDGGNLVCEIETFRGCPRYKTGGCSFCVEPSKGPTLHRDVDAIVAEISALYKAGARHFRLGNQTDFYAFHHGAYDDPRYPRPNVAAIHELLSSIRADCPDIKTLHIDNVNALNFALYPEEAREITRDIVEFCTPGNVAAIGVESVDPVVIAKNNLKCTANEILGAVEAINEIGSQVGDNGNPVFLPGLNFIMGLPGETKATLEADGLFLQSLLELDLLIRRVNLRKLMVPAFSKGSASPANRGDFGKQVQKNERLYYSWKNGIRESFDLPMLKRVFPFGTVLTGVYAEQLEGNSTLLRQPGTYPILCYVPKQLDLNKFYDLIVVDHGYRSITCLLHPVNLTNLNLGLKELESIPGIGKKRSASIFVKQPRSEADWLDIVDRDTYERLKRLQPDL